MTIECLVTYDVNTQDVSGERRLRQVAKVCEGIGDRVQKSVFEVRCSPAQLVSLLTKLEAIITDKDSIRIYRVDANQLAEVQTVGRQVPARPTGSRIF